MRALTASTWCALVLACAGASDANSHANLPPPPVPFFPSTEAGIALGERLFFDPMLSGDDTLSCASCHAPELAFSDGVALANIGASGVTLPRNAPGLTNVAWATALFWDGGAMNLESLVLSPLTNPDEMNQALGPLLDELAADERYVDEFEQAFPDDGLVIANVMRALAQYMRTLVSAGSRYDRFVRGEGGRLSEAELAGMQVYTSHCSSCHATDLFTDNGFHNNGIDSTFPEDPESFGRGRARATLDPLDVGAFKTPTLRNLGYTAPYMHDGRFATLEEVVEHYNSGVKAHPNLDPRLRVSPTGAIEPRRLNLTPAESASLVAFLKTLTDDELLKDGHYSDPFLSHTH